MESIPIPPEVACPYCHLSYMDLYAFDQHVNFHLEKIAENADFPCDKCEKRFLTSFRLQYHLKHDHPEITTGPASSENRELDSEISASTVVNLPPSSHHALVEEPFLHSSFFSTSVANSNNVDGSYNLMTITCPSEPSITFSSLTPPPSPTSCSETTSADTDSSKDQNQKSLRTVPLQTLRPRYTCPDCSTGCLNLKEYFKHTADCEVINSSISHLSIMDRIARRNKLKPRENLPPVIINDKMFTDFTERSFRQIGTPPTLEPGFPKISLRQKSQTLTQVDFSSFSDSKNKLPAPLQQISPPVSNSSGKNQFSSKKKPSPRKNRATSFFPLEQRDLETPAPGLRPLQTPKGDDMLRRLSPRKKQKTDLVTKIADPHLGNSRTFPKQQPHAPSVSGRSEEAKANAPDQQRLNNLVPVLRGLPKPSLVITRLPPSLTLGKEKNHVGRVTRSFSTITPIGCQQRLRKRKVEEPKDKVPRQHSKRKRPESKMVKQVRMHLTKKRKSNQSKRHAHQKRKSEQTVEWDGRSSTGPGSKYTETRYQLPLNAPLSPTPEVWSSLSRNDVDQALVILSKKENLK